MVVLIGPLGPPVGEDLDLSILGSNSLKQAYDIITKEENEEEKEEFDLNKDKHILKIRDRAKERNEPFSATPKTKKSLDHIFKTPNKELDKSSNQSQERGQQ